MKEAIFMMECGEDKGGVGELQSVIRYRAKEFWKF